MQPFEYQQRGIDEIIDKFKLHDKLLYQLATSGGKTAIFSFLSKWWLKNNPTNVLILCHRTELIMQAEATLSTIGIGSEPITAKVKHPKHHSRVYIGMVETVNNRLKKNPYFFPNIGLVICDEAHIMVFQKLFNFFPNAKKLGCTATPCVLKRITFWKCPYCKSNANEPGLECCGDVMQEWTKPFTLSHIYDDIIVGPEISELIEFGSVVKDISFIKHYTDDSKLKTDADGEFTTESIDSAYTDDGAVFNVLLNYKELCEGKKTIIFNSSAKTNLLIYEKFINNGYTNIRMFDSVNKEQSGHRGELLKWFDETPDAILCNVGVFTTGFDSREVQAIILNRPTGSLSLFIQIAGRGGRSSKKIYKDSFILVDGGGNIDRFGEWSAYRDWRKIFFKGTSKERAKVANAEDIQSCTECGNLYPKTEIECPECGAEIQPPTKRDRAIRESNIVNMPIRAIPPPNGEKIYKYTVSMGENINFAFKIMINQIADMFRFYRVTKEKYESSKRSGELNKKISKMINKCYFVLLSKKDIAAANNRTIAYLQNKTISKLDKYYENK